MAWKLVLSFLVLSRCRGSKDISSQLFITLLADLLAFGQWVIFCNKRLLPHSHRAAPSLINTFLISLSSICWYAWTATMGNKPSHQKLQEERTVFLSKDNAVYRIPSLFYDRDNKSFMAFAEQRETVDDSSTKHLVMKTGTLKMEESTGVRTIEVIIQTIVSLLNYLWICFVSFTHLWLMFSLVVGAQSGEGGTSWWTSSDEPLSSVRENQQDTFPVLHLCSGRRRRVLAEILGL